MIGVYNTWMVDRLVTIRFSRFDGQIKILQVTYYGVDVINECNEDFFERAKQEISNF
jgi:hypothetical protein